MSTIPRFFVPPEAIAGNTAMLPSEVLHHARTVLRLRPGESLILHDGKGFAYDAVLSEGKSSVVQITGRYALDTEPVLKVTIAQALPKTSDKIEQVLQHGTEIGAAGFVFFQSARSVARMETRDKVEKRLERWAEIIKSAAEQSRRAVLPTVAWEPRLSGVCTHIAQFPLALILHESATVPLSAFSDAIQLHSKAIILVGPEGGFTDEEVKQMADEGGKAIHLGPRILRTETAALVGLSQLLYAKERGITP